MSTLLFSLAVVSDSVSPESEKNQTAAQAVLRPGQPFGQSRFFEERKKCIVSRRGPIRAGGNTESSGQKMSRAGKHRTHTAPPIGYGEAGKGFFAVRFRQIASNHSVSDLSSPEGRHHSDRLAGPLTPFHLLHQRNCGWTYQY